MIEVVIHGTAPDGTKDEVVVTGETIEPVQIKAQESILIRGWTDCWSEETENSDD